MQVAHTCCFHMLTCNALKLNIIVCVTEGMRLYALVTLMYKLARAQRHLKKKKTLTVLRMLFSCVVGYNSECMCLGLPHTSSDLY